MKGSIVERRTFMQGVVTTLIKEQLPKLVEPCEEALTGRRFAVDDPSSELLTQIRANLAEKSKALEVPEEKFEQIFEEKIAPVFHEIAPAILAEV